MIRFITLFVFISVVFGQTSTTDLGCGTKTLCNLDKKPTYRCADGTDPYVCVYVPPSNTVDGSTVGTCGWQLSANGCPVPVKCDCSNVALPPTQEKYLCQDCINYGGVCTCNADCTAYDVSSCDRYTPKAGYCPVVATGVACFKAGDVLCLGDTVCPENQKCCMDVCGGRSCQTPTDILVRPGVCPVASTLGGGDLGICSELCTYDNDCADGTKCCENQCGGHQCSAPATTNDICVKDDCAAALPPTAKFCPDATTLQVYTCSPVATTNSDGTVGSTTKTCAWTPNPCPDVTPPTTNPGSCPIPNKGIACTIDGKNTCTNDGDCPTTDQKCCFNSCNFVCETAVPPDTCVTGDKNLVCLDKATFDAAAANGGVVSDTSIPTDDYCYFQCTQDYACSFDATTSLCTRGDDFQKCCDLCKTPDPTPVTPTCEHKTPCDCLSDTANNCGWCQVTAYATDKTATTTSFVWGYCSSPSGTTTCSAPPSAGGNGGTFCTLSPIECTNNDAADPSISDTSSAFTDPAYKDGFNQINTGAVSEADLQKVVATLIQGCSITIKRILSADASNGKGTVRTIIQVDCPADATTTEDEVCISVTKGYAASCKIPETSFSDCKLQTYSETGTATTVKRTVTSGSYLQTATVTPTTPDNNTGTSSAGILAPVWIMLFAIFLFFRM